MKNPMKNPHEISDPGRLRLRARRQPFGRQLPAGSGGLRTPGGGHHSGTGEAEQTPGCRGWGHHAFSNGWTWENG